jgi:hypothetical protein
LVLAADEESRLVHFDLGFLELNLGLVNVLNLRVDLQIHFSFVAPHRIQIVLPFKNADFVAHFDAVVFQFF